MKTLLLLIFLALTFNIHAQNEESEKAKNSLKIQGGILFDKHSNGNYLGFNQLSIGWSNLKENKLSESSVELIRYTTDSQEKSGPDDTPSWIRQRESMELEFFRSVLHVGGGRENGIYLGPTASFLYLKNDLLPTMTSQYRLVEKSYSFRAGIKAAYLLKLSKKLSLNISSKLNLVDFGYDSEHNFDPNIPIRSQTHSGIDFDLSLPRQYQLLVGLNIKF